MAFQLTIRSMEEKMPETNSTSPLVSVARYWQRTLLDADLQTVDVQGVAGSVEVDRKAIESGALGADQVATLASASKEAGSSRSDKSPAGADEESVPHDKAAADADRLKVLVIPFLVTRRAEDQFRRNTGSEQALTPLVIPALVDRQTGRLSPRPGELPWVAREFLEPVGRTGLVIGSQDEVDNYLTATEAPGEAAGEDPAAVWAAWYGYANGMLPEGWLGRIEQQGYAIIATGGRVLPDDGARGVNKALIEAYDAIRATPTSASALFASYASRADDASHAPLAPSQWDPTRHVGHVNAQHALSVSQRVAIAHALATPAGNLFPLNGPPGTGKTTWLHALWSSLWVKAAIDGEQRPPLIVVSSTNNQAVTNVLDSLAKDVQEPRWLPPLPNAQPGRAIDLLGIYLAAKSKAAEAEAAGTRTTSPRMEYFQEIEKPSEYTAAARAHWLQEFHKASPKAKATSVEQGVEHLRKVLQRFALLAASVVRFAYAANDLERKLAKGYAPHGLERAREHFGQAERKAGEEVRRCAERSKQWDAYLGGESIWQGLLGVIPSVRQSRAARDRTKLSELGVNIDELPREHALPSRIAREAVLSMLAEQTKVAREMHAKAQEALRRANEHAAMLGKALGQFESVMQAISTDQALQVWLPPECQVLAKAATALHRQDVDEFEAGTGLQPWLDRTLRYAMFRVAVHYWEGRWIIAIEQARAAKTLGWRPTPERLQASWGRRAMLTPCFVTTMHTGSKIFTCQPLGEARRPHWGVIDWLVVDESGQIAPETAGPMMAVAQRAVTVGDRMQTPPVWSVVERIDAANARRFQVAGDSRAYERLADQSMASASGSVLGIAQRRSPWVSPHMPERGLYLLEHRRCVDPVIAYCNELAYAGRIQPKRGMAGIKDGHPWPHLGFAHIPGESELQAGSRRNVFEAKMIADWLLREGDAIRTHYGKATLGECMAIITPFTAQKQAIMKAVSAAFRRSYDVVGDLTVGTVHSMQGAERPLILFSSVYSAGDGSKSYFFDREASVLNVAVSRAKDSFLAFGDMGIFRPSAQSASGLLARHLSRDRSQEIVLSYAGVRRDDLISPGDEPVVLYNLVDHQLALAQALADARHSLTIVSPWVSMQAITSDALPEKTRAAVDRGVQVVVFTDEASLRGDAKDPKKLPYEALAQLGAAGAKVLRVQEPLHAKMLLVDDALFVEGSFNWLSASRDDQYAKFESSVSYAGPRVAEHIEKARSLLGKLAAEELRAP